MSLFSSISQYWQSQQQVAADKEIAQLEYDAAMKQIDAQQKANQEQQLFNQKEAEKAYQRGSSAGQLKQLMEAGLSEQQARQIIAAGSTGGYTPAASVNQMSGVDLTAPAHQEAAMVQANADAQKAFTQFNNEVWSNTMAGWIDHAYSNIPNYIDQGVSIGANVLNTSLTASDGGIIGNMQTASLQGQILRNINSLPASARGSYAAFTQYASSSEAPAWMKTADFQNALQSATTSPMAMKSMRNFFDTSNQLLTGDTYFKNLLNESEMKSAAAKIASFKVDQERVATDIALLESDYKIQILPDRYAAILAGFQADLAEMSQKAELWNNDNYKREWLKAQINKEEECAILSKVMSMKHNGEFKYLKDNPEMQQLFAIYRLFDDAGMTDTMFGEVVATIEAYGKTSFDFGVSDIISGIHDWISPPETEAERKKKQGQAEFWQNYYESYHQPHK